MPSQAPNDFDPDIPLRVKGPLDMLGGFEGAIGLAGRLQLGKMAQGATDENGNVDYDKLLSSAAQNPFTVQYINPLRQAQLTQRQITGLIQTQNKQNADDVNMLLASTASNPAEAPSMLQAFLSRVPAANRAAAATYAGTLLQGALTHNGQVYDPRTPEGQDVFKKNMIPLAAASGMNATQVGTTFMPPHDVALGYTSPAEAYKPVPGPPTPGGQQTNITAAQFAARQNGLGANAPQGNTLAPSGVGMPTEISPSTKQLMTTLGTQFSDEDKKAYDNAQLLLGNVAEMRNDLSKLTSNPNIMTLTGPGASARLDAAKTWNLAMQGLGVKDSKYMVDTNQVGSMEDLIKQANRAAFAYMSSVMGVQREGWQTVARAAKSVPGAENSPVGLNYIMNSLEETANWKSAQRYFELNYLQNPNNQGLIGAEEAFNKQYPIQAFIDRGMSKTQDPLSGKYVSPIKVKSPADLKQYLPGTVVQLPDGRMVTVTQKYSGFAPLPQPGQ